ncbi:protein of unknown function [Pseudobutyrivibrio sp. UC1225]|uniref:CD1107 family mobile element protein n=1 Tax=Pseudobutyrivibrio sp. UC1225 TaxID=1798185 RepID=UPI0008E064CA|nr:DUF4366 domain-containing protein [Pseudobutyrivibrio sp. UC1225]SFO29460.1 protein of unknown function [Pseudobutyrivibrio sp. UC1225]
MKRMKLKLMMLTLAGALTLAFVPITAEAHVPANVDTSVIDEEEDEDVDEGDDVYEEHKSLTPAGNLSIVDDFDEKESEGKQFITVTTKNGNIFYLIIDRDDNGDDTVHFLNLVDERDLLDLLDDDEKKELEKEKKAAEATPTVTAEEQNPKDKGGDTPKESKQKTTKKANKSDIFVICILIGMAGVGGLYFYSNKASFIKKKTGPIIDDGEEYITIPSGPVDKDYDDIPVD